ncbi:MAG: SIS domain-containing protein [Blastocatellia bacterium]
MSVPILRPRFSNHDPESFSTVNDTAPEDRFEESISEMITESLDVKCRYFSFAAPDIARAARTIVQSMRIGGKLLLFGNGGSAADAQHIAAELAFKMDRQRPALPAIALTTDTSLLTAVSNDSSFQYVFSRQVAAIGRAGDVAIGISTSGNSPNVIEAFRQARRMGISTIGLLGGGDGGRAAMLVDQALVVPSHNTPRIQEIHIEVGHILCQLIEDAMFPQQR